MNTEQCRARFATASVARLATVSATGAPHLVPVTFAMDRDTIVFAVDHKPKSTTALRRLTNIAAEPRVCYLADEYSDDWTRLWWVRADAVARIIDSGPEFAAALDLLAESYRQYRDRRPAGPVVAAMVTWWTGWSASC